MEPTALLGLVMLIGVYFVPSFIASKREHHNTTAIVVLNLVAGWIPFVWLIALVWSCTAIKSELKENKE